MFHCISIDLWDVGEAAPISRCKTSGFFLAIGLGNPFWSRKLTTPCSELASSEAAGNCRGSPLTNAISKSRTATQQVF